MFLCGLCLAAMCREGNAYSCDSSGSSLWAFKLQIWALLGIYLGLFVGFHIYNKIFHIIAPIKLFCMRTVLKGFILMF